MKLLFSAFLLLSAIPALADTAIETETAQIGKKGEMAFSQSIEFGKSSDGTSIGTLTQFEYALSDRSEILIEPFFHLWEMPKDGEYAEGPGDLEITPSYMFVRENGWVPAVLAAFKLKVPTGSENVGGTKKFDYYPYFIFGQHYGNLIFNANLGVNFATPPEGGALEQNVVWDLEAETEIFENLTMFYEAFSAEDAVKTVSTALEYKFSQHFNAFIAFSYSEENERIVRPGLNFEF